MILRSFPDTKEAGTALVAVSAVASLLSVLLPRVASAGYIPPTNVKKVLTPEKVIDAGTCVVYAHMAAAADARGAMPEVKGRYAAAVRTQRLMTESPMVWN